MSGASFASLGPTLLARKGGAKPAMRPQIAPLPGVVPPEAEQLEDLGWNDMGQDDAGQYDAGQHQYDAGQHDAGQHDVGQHDGGLIDMGQTHADAGTVVPITAPAAPVRADAVADTLDANSPLVHRQQRRLAERILADNGHANTPATGLGEDSYLVNHDPADAAALEAETAPEINADLTAPKKRPKKRKATAKKAPKAAVSKGKAKSGKQARRAAFTLRLDTDRHLKLRLAATMQGMSAQALVTEALDAMLSEIDDLDALAERFNTKLRHN